ncbi:MAG: hypothetical protein KatS3mg003_2209 [Candidatus Nitrosocaldaceae archaeon]|nr:MAG: hypothetical protein KatS3mg003_2209 [Candidatus Nitrosocaldaceae archaeon]
MENLGYNTRGPLIEKLKSLLNDVQGKYEAFLDAQALFEQGKLDEREFFARMGEFVKLFASLGFLTVKVMLELDKAIGKEEKVEEGTKPMPIPDYETFTKPRVEQKEERRCKSCNAKIPETAKFCTKCGAKQ